MNSFVSVIRILEMPTVKLVFNEIVCIKLLVQLPKDKYESSIFELVIWDDLLDPFLEFYRYDNFILVDGYLSGYDRYEYFQNGILIKINTIQLTAINVYPLY